MESLISTFDPQGDSERWAVIRENTVLFREGSRVRIAGNEHWGLISRPLRRQEGKLPKTLPHWKAKQHLLLVCYHFSAQLSMF